MFGVGHVTILSQSGVGSSNDTLAGVTCWTNSYGATYCLTLGGWRTFVIVSTQIAPHGRAYQFTVADRIRVAREQSGMDQQDLADASGLSRQSISNYERQVTTPRRPQLAAIALATGFDYEWLETGAQPPSQRPGGAPVNPVPTTPDSKTVVFFHPIAA